MNSKVIFAAFTLTASLVFGDLASAQFTQVAPFIGNAAETFDGHDLSGGVVNICVFDRVFSGQADLCAESGAASGILSPSFGLGCQIGPFEGSRFFANSSGASLYTFDSAVTQFGGYFTTGSTGPADGTIEFFDAGGTLIFSDILTVPNFCTWTWNGWDTGGALVSTIRVVSNQSGGSFMMMDDMRAEIQAGVLPGICNGDGGNQMGCTNCPCGNNAAPGTVGGCLNSAGTSAQLLASGNPSVSLPANVTTDLRFALSGAPANAFCILNSGDGVAPGNMANPCFGMQSGSQSLSFDGLRCAIVNTRRHGGRSADANGDVGLTNNPWGGEGGPPAGLAVAGGGFMAGQTRFFQVINRDEPLQVCQRGLNTSQALSVTFTN